MEYSLSDFDFDLPDELIAQQPASPRDAAKLLVFDRQTGQITDAIFRDIAHFLPDKTTLVLNNTKVDKCRLRFGNLEVFILETVNDRSVRALIKPGPKFKLHKMVQLAEGIEAEVTAVDADGIRTLVFNYALDDTRLDNFRLTPLPPYIAQNEKLAEEYQTVYAKTPGSKAAPTAGLHFTPELLTKIKEHHSIAEVTLEVGLGTFAPIKTDKLDEVHLHQETYHISAETAKLLNQAEHITAVGTTSVRTLEAAAAELHSQSYDLPTVFKEASGATEIFIYPGYRFKAVDALITNFHLPKTSLLMMIAAFMGYEEMMCCYRHAIEQSYRFYSFGDAMLII